MEESWSRQSRSCQSQFGGQSAMSSSEGTLWKAVVDEVEGYKEPLKTAVDRHTQQINSALNQLNACLWPAASGVK